MKNKDLERISNSISDWNEVSENYHNHMYEIITNEPIGEVRELGLESIKKYENDRRKGDDKFFNLVAKDAYEAGKLRGMWHGGACVVGGFITGTLVGKLIIKIVEHAKENKKE